MIDKPTLLSVRLPARATRRTNRLAVALLVALVAFGLSSSTGCRPTGDKAIEPVSAPATAVPAKSLYGVVPPEQIDPSLTPEQLARMFTPLDSIPWVALIDANDPNFLRDDVTARAAEPVDSNYPLVSDPRKAYMRGRWLLGRGKFDAAAKLLAAALPSDPNSAQMHELLARAYYGTGDTAAAMNAALRATEYGPDRLLGYLLLGNSFLTQRHYDQAVSAYRRALQSPQATDGNPLTTVGRLQLAGALAQTHYLAAAAEQYRKVYRLLKKPGGQSEYSQTSPIVGQLTAGPHLPLLALASLHMQMGQIEQAARTLDRTQQLLDADLDITRIFLLSQYAADEDIALQYNRVVALCRYLLYSRDNAEHAIVTFHRACFRLNHQDAYLDELARWTVPAEPHGPLLTPRGYAFGLTLAQRYDEAQAILEGLLRAAEIDPLVQRDLGRLHGKKQEFPEMILAYADFLSRETASVDAVLAEIENHLARAKDLPQLLTQWFRDDRLSQSHLACFVLGHLAARRGADELAEQCLRHSLTLRPGYVNSRKHLSELLLRQKRYDEVLALVDIDAEPSLHEPQELGYAGQASIGLGKFDQAARFYRRLIERRSDDITAYLALADALTRQNDFRQAQDILLKVHADWPGQQVTYRQLLDLYVRWNAAGDITPAQRLATEKHARQMLRRWLVGSRTGAALDSAVSPQESQQLRSNLTLATDTLERLAEEFPTGRAAGVLLTGLYSVQGSYDKAAALIERLLVHYSDDTLLLAQGARFSRRLNDFEQAAEYGVQLQRLEPNNPLILSQTLHALRLAHRVDDALELLLTAAQRPSLQTPLAVRILQIESRPLFVITRRYHKAVELMEQWYPTILAETPAPDQAEPITGANEQLAHNLIWALTEAGLYERAALQLKDMHQRYEQADTSSALYLVRHLNIRRRHNVSLELLTELLRYQADSVALRMELWLTMAQAGEPDQALAEAEARLSDDPNDPIRHVLLASLSAKLGKYDRALELYRGDPNSQVQLPPSHYLQIEQAEILLAAERFDQAQALLSQPPPSDDVAANWLDLRIKLHTLTGDCNAALALADDFAELPQAPRAEADTEVQTDIIRVAILAACGRYADAAQLQRKIVSQRPDDTAARMQYSVHLERLGRIDEAVAELEEALSRYPDHPVILNNLAYSLIEGHRDPNRAHNLLTRSIRQDPESASTLDSLGWFYYKMGEFQRALEYIYQAGAGFAEPDPEILEHLGDTVYRLERTDDALWYWLKALEAVGKRFKSEPHLQKSKSRLEEKLEQLGRGAVPTVAPLF